jgi:hypothetical protein
MKQEFKRPNISTAIPNQGLVAHSGRIIPTRRAQIAGMNIKSTIFLYLLFYSPVGVKNLP